MPSLVFKRSTMNYLRSEGQIARRFGTYGLLLNFMLWT